MGMENEETKATVDMTDAVQFCVYGTIIGFALACIIHFFGSKLGGFVILDGLVPVNESIWEHLKVAFYPCIIVNLLVWCDFVRKIPLGRRVLMASLSAFIAQGNVWLGYYGMKFGWKFEGMAVDFTILAISILLGLLHAIFLLQFHVPKWVNWIGGIYLICMIICNYIFAFYPLAYPIFVS